MKSQKLKKAAPSKQRQIPAPVSFVLHLGLYTLLLFASFFVGLFWVSGTFKDWVRGQAGKLRKQDRPKA